MTFTFDSGEKSTEDYVFLLNECEKPLEGLGVGKLILAAGMGGN